MHVSLVEDLSLSDYVRAREAHCSRFHRSPCVNCERMLRVAQLVLTEGYCSLYPAFSIVSPGVKYTAETARRKLLQMPLVAVRLGNPNKGNSFTILLEYCHGVDYSRLSLVVDGVAGSLATQSPQGIDKNCVKMLLSLAQSDRERECLRYAIFKASGMSATRARHQYGFERMTERSAQVEQAIAEVQQIRETVDDIARMQNKALLASFGIKQVLNSDSSDSSCDETEHEDESISLNLSPDILELCKKTLSQSSFNWFELQEVLEAEVGCDVGRVMKRVFFDLPKLGFTHHEVDLVTQSREAYIAAMNDAYDSQRTVRVLNGCVVTDTEPDDPQSFASLRDPFSESGRLLICQRQRAIQRQTRRLRAKAIAEQRFLSKKVSRRVSKILTDCQGIGKVIENFVSEHNVGADAWRRTGVLTFDGNARLPQKVTYERIRLHLQTVYGRHFSYGSVVQLCVARNKRHLSSKRYQGIAQVTTRRARKGFTLKYNPDAHWSASFYKGLNTIQLQDGRDMCFLNRDDASGFRLDTLTTCKQYASPAVKGNDVLTTRTDYVNKYPSTLQTTSCNFSATNTTPQVCVGIVKAPSSVHHKNPCQHAADLCMLERQEELKYVFINPETGDEKAVDCIRVDGASDEGPSHEEVQYYWTERHLLRNKVATLITTRSSGSSYLNRVELQNGCLSRGHSNTFIPSTLAGACYDPDTGAVDQCKLKQNMRLAIEAYIKRVDGCPCGESQIRLYCGAESSEQQEVREKLLIFLKGSNVSKESLRTTAPTLYTNFQLIWKVRANHMVSGLPSYVFFLLCCYKKDCPHPRCQAGPPQTISTWYPGGPPLSHLPLPIPDKERPWGGTCSTCKGVCSGHYKTQLVDVHDRKALSQVPKPPSAALKKLFSSTSGLVTDSMIESAAKEVQLPSDECTIWIKHLQTVLENRRRGARKAAATRRARRTGRAQVSEHGSSSQAVDMDESSHASQVFTLPKCPLCVCVCACVRVCAFVCVFVCVC